MNVSVFSAQSFIRESSIPMKVDVPKDILKESFYIQGINFLTGIKQESTLHKAELYKAIYEHANDFYAVQEGVSDFFQWIKEFIKKVINFFKLLLQKFWVRINSFFGRDKYIEKHKDVLKDFGSEHEFDFKGYKYTIHDGIPSIDPIVDSDKYLAELSDLSGEKRNIKSYKDLDKAYKKFIDDTESSHYLSEERAQILCKPGVKIDGDDFKDECFRAFRDNDDIKSTITATANYVQQCLHEFTNYEKTKSRTEKQRDQIDRIYNQISKRFDDIAKKVYGLSKADEDMSVDSINVPAGTANKEDVIFVVHAFAKAIATRVEELSGIHIQAFTAKLDAIKEQMTQNRAVLYGAFKRILAKKKMWATEAAAELTDTYLECDAIPEPPSEIVPNAGPKNTDVSPAECGECNVSEDAALGNYRLMCVDLGERLRGFSEMLISANEGASVTQLGVIQEGIGDKLKNVWEKFKGLLERIWGKFTNYIHRLVDKDTEYLEHYRDTILNVKPAEYAFEMEDHFTGIARIRDVKIQPFSNYEASISQDSDNVNFMSKIIPGYDKKTPWNAFCIQYFNGGSTQMKYNLNTINMTDMYNFCHDFKSDIEKVLENDKKTLENTVNSINSKISAAKAELGPNAKTEATVDSAFSKLFLEDIKPENSNDGKGPTSAEKETGKGETKDSTTKISKNIGSSLTQNANNQSTNADNGKDANGQDKQTAKAADDVEMKKSIAELEEMEKKVTTYKTVTLGVLTGKLTAAQSTYNDFMKLIKTHVNQQVGKNGDTQNAQQGTNYTNNNIDLKNLGYNPEGQTPEAASTMAKNAAIEMINNVTPNKDNNTPESITKYKNTITERIKAGNPNFNGNFDMILQAMTNKVTTDAEKTEVENAKKALDAAIAAQNNPNQGTQP